MRGLPRLVKESLQKACDSALLAVEDYNRPATTFKSGAYVILMTIAWASLFHAIFLRNGVKPYHKEPNGRYKRVDGGYSWWELSTCLDQFYKNDHENAVCKNLRLFLPLRNEFEHRGYPELDADLFGECQQMLLNFDESAETQFGSKWSLHESLSFSLQLFGGKQTTTGRQLIPNPDSARVKGIIESFRSSVSSETLQTGKYAFKAFLIRVANHESQDALAVQFIDYDMLNDEQRQSVVRDVAMVKTIRQPVANLDKLKPGEVVARVQAALGNPMIERNGKESDKITMDVFVRCWRKHGVRPPSGDAHPDRTKPEFCVYDAVHKDYCYTEAYVMFLIKKLSDEDEFQSLYS
jgi:hypothetical protein